MARIETKVYILSSYIDYIGNFGYLKVLAEFGCITIRMSKRQMVDNEFYLSPDLYLQVELEKGTKNWSLKEILGYKKLLELKHYSDHLAIIKVKEFLSKNIKDNQELDILEPFLTFMSKYNSQNKDSKETFIDFDLKKFQLMIFQQLGFSARGGDDDYQFWQANYDNSL